MTDKPYIVGLTGPTGSGKSEVARILAEDRLPVIDADVLARRVVEPGTACLRELAQAFGGDIVNGDGTLNRHRLAARAFATPENTKLLNSITHPYIIALTAKILKKMREAREPAAVIDAPLLFESGMDGICDKTVAVVAPEEERLRRILLRDGMTERLARERMAAQNPESYYTSRAAVVLKNDGGREQLCEEAAKLAVKIREWAHG